MSNTFCVRRALIAASVLLASGVHAQPQTPFKLGIAPHTSARVILEMYAPLRTHLEKTLGGPVEIVTAPNFTEFAKRMLNQEFDLAVTTGHQARLAQTDAQYTPLLTYAADFRAVTLVAGNGPIHKVSDLREKPVLGLSETSLVTLWGQHWLAKNGIKKQLRYVSASDSVARLVLEGQAAAGFASMANYQSLDRGLQTQLRFLAISEPMAGRVYVLNKQQQPRQDLVKNALNTFGASDVGKAYFAKYMLDGYRPLRAKELEVMDPYAAEVRQSLK